jgi:hypothetical protein
MGNRHENGSNGLGLVGAWRCRYPRSRHGSARRIRHRHLPRGGFLAGSDAQSRMLAHVSSNSEQYWRKLQSTSREIGTGFPWTIKSPVHPKFRNDFSRSAFPKLE